MLNDGGCNNDLMAPFFLSWDQVNLILEKSGQPYFGPLYFKLGPFWKIKATLKNNYSKKIGANIFL